MNVWTHSGKPEEQKITGVAEHGATDAVAAQHVYRWTYSQLKPTAGKEAEAATEAGKKVMWTADQQLDSEQGRLPSIAWTTFRSWEQVGAWYRGLEADRIVPDESVTAKAKEVTAGKTTDEEKARAIYHYVATNIRYIGVALGIGRYQPHMAVEILSNQYGDCKDKHTLLAAMLESVGLHADAVLIGSQLRFNEAVPSPEVFNHLITRLTLPGAKEPVWLDSTAEVAPWGLLTGTIRDKQALVVVTAPARGTPVAYIARTPEASPIANQTTVESTGTLDVNGVATSHVVVTTRGDGELLLRAVLRQVGPSAYENTVQQLAKGLGFPGVTSNAELSNPTDTEKPFTMAFDYKVDKQGDWEHKRVVAQLAPVVLQRVSAVDPPNHDIQLGPPHTVISHSVLKLPDGWTAIVPPHVSVTSAFGTYQVTFRFENGTVYADRRLETLVKKVPVAQWKTYMEWSDQTLPGQERLIQLRPATMSALLETRRRALIRTSCALSRREPRHSATSRFRCVRAIQPATRRRMA